MKAGANFKEFGELRANFAADLSMVRDNLNTGGSSNSTLRQYYMAYDSALVVYTFAASAWEHKILRDQCIGPAPHLSGGSESKRMSIDERLGELDSTLRSVHRAMDCFKQDEKQVQVLQRQAEPMKMNCPHPYDLDCVLKNAEAKLGSAEALFLKK